MDLISEQHGDITLVRVEATRIDAAVAIQFKDEMRTATEEGSGRVVLDLSDVDFSTVAALALSLRP